MRLYVSFASVLKTLNILEVVQVIPKERLEHSQINARKDAIRKLESSVAELGLETLNESPLSQVSLYLDERGPPGYD
jgi:hypothetical protein